MKITEKLVELARFRGAPDFFDVEVKDQHRKFLKDIKYQHPTTGAKFDLPVKKQLEQIEQTCDAPYQGGNYIYIISAEMSPMRAQALALELFYNAIDDYAHREAVVKDAPLWHTVFGGYTDALRDGKVTAADPSLLIIDGLVTNATDIKVEKARDLLMKYRRIPRIVITCGCCPLTFAYERLFVPINRAAYFGNAKVVTI